ncbi:MAG: hypothetical protein IPP45_11365 [Sphingomonadales bacterium]|nr:hypothetical protein [Sphingomonadales bacterium]
MPEGDGDIVLGRHLRHRFSKRRIAAMDKDAPYSGNSFGHIFVGVSRTDALEHRHGNDSHKFFSIWISADVRTRAHRSLREKSPVYFDGSCGMYMVLGYDEVRDISADPETFSSVTGLLLVKESSRRKSMPCLKNLALCPSTRWSLLIHPFTPFIAHWSTRPLTPRPSSACRMRLKARFPVLSMASFGRAGDFYSAIAAIAFICRCGPARIADGRF